MTLDLATKLLDAGLEQARQAGLCCSVAIVDDRGWLVAFHRMDGAIAPTFDIAWGKAWTASVFRIPTSEVVRYGNRRSANLGFDTSNWNDRLTTIPGGLPIFTDNQLLGGIGCSGGTPAEDVTICQKALDVISGGQE